jgi:integrase
MARKAGLLIVRFHDCRHSATTIMLFHGIPPSVIMKTRQAVILAGGSRSLSVFLGVLATLVG